MGRLTSSGRRRAWLVFAVLGLASGAPNAAQAEALNPCALIAGNMTTPAPSIASADRYADLLTVFSQSPDRRNLPLRRLKSSAELDDLREMLDKGGAKAEWRTATAGLRDAIVANRDAALADEADGVENESQHPFTEAARVFTIDERDADGKPLPIFFLAGPDQLTEVTFEAGKRRPQITAVRSFGPFVRFGAYEIDGTRLLYRVADSANPAGVHRVEVFPLTIPPQHGAATHEPPICSARVVIAAKHALEAHVAPGGKAPSQGRLDSVRAILTSLLDGAHGGSAAGPLLQVYDLETGASRTLPTADPRAAVAAEIGVEAAAVDGALSAIGWGPSSPAAGSQAPGPRNIESLLGDGAGWNRDMLLLAKAGDEASVLCAVYEVPLGTMQDAFSSLLSSGHVTGAAACVLTAPGKAGDAAATILAERAAAESGDGYAYWIVESQIVIGLPSSD